MSGGRAGLGLRRKDAGHPVYDACLGIAVGIRLRSVHEALRVVRVVEGPVIYSAACDSATEILRIAQHQHSRGGTSERKALDAYARAVDIGQRLKPLSPGDVVAELHDSHPSEGLVHALAAVLP